MQRLELPAVFAVGFAAMCYVQSGSYEPSGRDSFYHTKMAVLMGTGEVRFPETFPWLHHSIFNRDHFVSHHYGLHITLAPWVHGSSWVAGIAPAWLREWAASGGGEMQDTIHKWLEDPYLLGAKCLVSILFGAQLLLVASILKHLDVGCRWFWVMAMLALPSDFVLRMSYVRAPAVSIVMMLGIMLCCLRAKPIFAGVLTFVYIHLYLGGLVFAPVILGLFTITYLVTGKGWRTVGPILASGVVGWGLAILSNPFGPGEAIAFLYTQLFETGLQLASNTVSVGKEWRPYDFEHWARLSAFVLAIFGVSVVFRSTWNRVLTAENLIFFLLNLAFLGLCLKARRFIEYWPVMCLLSAAVLWRGVDASRRAVSQKLSESPDWQRSFARLYPAACIGAAVVGGATLNQARATATCSFKIQHIKRAMSYIQEDSDPGAIIFADDWDVFPMFFYYNHHNYYVCGLDPQFVNSIDPELWERYCVITQGRAPKDSRVQVVGDDGQPVTRRFRVELEDIREYFGASYVVVDKDHADFYRQLQKSDFVKAGFPSKRTRSRRPPTLSVFKVLPPSTEQTGEEPVEND